MKLTAEARYTPRSSAGRFIAEQIAPATHAATEDVGQIVLQEAQAIVPVDTGELRDSGAVEMRDADASSIALVRFTAGHASYVEYGTGIRGASSPGAGPYPYNPAWPGMPAQPYLRPALDKVRPEMLGMYGLRMRF